MRKVFAPLLAITAALFACNKPCSAAEAGWTIKQVTLSQGKQNVSLTSKAVLIELPKQKYRIYSFAPNWNVIYINDNIGTYADFPHTKFIGSIIGRLGTQMGNDVQFLALPKPKVENKDGESYSVYDYGYRISDADLEALQQKKTYTPYYKIRSVKARYLRLPSIPKEAKELVCKVTCVPMSNEIPIKFSARNFATKPVDVVETGLVKKETAITIAPPDLKNLKLVKNEHELFSSTRVDDVFELFGDRTYRDKKSGK